MPWVGVSGKQTLLTFQGKSMHVEVRKDKSGCIYEEARDDSSSLQDKRKVFMEM